MSHISDDICLSQSTTSTRGCTCRPSEKVQAMLEDHQQEKQASEKQALIKAKHCEELTRKREQASKAVEQGLDSATVTGTTNAAQKTNTVHSMQALAPDNAFTSRPVVASNNASVTRAALSSLLIARKGNVPPVPSLARMPPKFNPVPKQAATGMLLQCVCALMPTQSMKVQKLKRERAVLNIDELSTTNDSMPKNPSQLVSLKRACDHEPTPFPPSQ
ncbi:hypothetical protein JVT61DRAFT_6275 [Boletus reticuloceps]|uniref:Uncharacterized protein n=1 Tax=Boletus reticuloceps TaxID=495285 RepID=A0A8I2YJL3_9AGAM|nr:hypothetical protein JVT61DRAFT_6275 [Boletus reticuloceps]